MNRLLPFILLLFALPAWAQTDARMAQTSPHTNPTPSPTDLTSAQKDRSSPHADPTPPPANQPSVRAAPTTSHTGQSSPHTDQSLDGDWKFLADTAGKGLAEGWNQHLPETAIPVRVPHTWNIMKGYEEYYGKAWYEKDFQVPADWQDHPVRLKFDAVYHDAFIYVNGQKAGEHLHSGYTAFYVDISRLIRPGATNTLVVVVDNSFTSNALPYERSFDWPNDGGIIRSVHLIRSGRPSIRYVHIDPLINFSDTSGQVVVKIRLWEDDIRQASFTIALREKKPIIPTTPINPASQPTTPTTSTTPASPTTPASQPPLPPLVTKDVLLTRQGDEFIARIPLPAIRLWHFDHPNLYQAEVTVKNKSVTTDDRSVVFGFKRLEIQGSRLFLNKEPVRLPGLEYMPSSYPGYGSAEPYWVMDTVAALFKDLNIKISRFHWQVDEHMLDLFDQDGILLQEEIPWWHQPGELSPEMMQVARQQLTEMIESDYNHPCIFAWGLSNEVTTNDLDQYRTLKQFAKGLDSTRMINIVTDNTPDRGKQAETLIGDLPTWNEYVGTWRGKATSELPGYLTKVEDLLGGRPLFITENGLCEPHFPGGDLRRISDMLYHYNEWARRDYIAACIYFCLNDYRTHMGEDGAGKFKARIHGLTDLYFNKKPSYYVYRQLAAPIEIVDVKKLSDTQLKVDLKNKNSLPSYSVRGYRIRWQTTGGAFREAEIPFLRPGDTTSLVLTDMQQRFSFTILSPTGSSVTGYPLLHE